jgi:parallel beta-helix repeat protein
MGRNPGRKFMAKVHALLIGTLCLTLFSLAAHTQSTGHKIVRAGNGEDLQACIHDAGDGGTCLVPRGYTEEPTFPVTMPNNYFTLLCEERSVITRGYNAPIITITGTADTIRGCTFDGNLSSFNVNARIGDVIAASAAHDLTFASNKVMNGGRVGIFLDSVIGGVVSNNIFTGNQADGVYGLENASGILVTGNIITTPLSGTWRHAIGFHSQTPSTYIMNITIRDNLIYNGESFCVEVGAFGGGAPSGITVADNFCDQLPGTVGGFGGYSFDTVTSPVVSNNAYLNFTTAMPSLPGLELVNGTGATASGNRLANASVSLNKQTYSTVTGSLIYLSQPFPAAQSSAFYIGSSTAVSNNNDTVQDNIVTVTFPNPPNRFYGVWIQCNHANISCDNITLQNNYFESEQTLNYPGIRVENDAATKGATIDNLLLKNNTIHNWSTCSQISASGVSYTTVNESGNCQ